MLVQLMVSAVLSALAGICSVPPRRVLFWRHWTPYVAGVGVCAVIALNAGAGVLGAVVGRTIGWQPSASDIVTGTVYAAATCALLRSEVPGLDSSLSRQPFTLLRTALTWTLGILDALAEPEVRRSVTAMSDNNLTQCTWDILHSFLPQDPQTPPAVLEQQIQEITTAAQQLYSSTDAAEGRGRLRGFVLRQTMRLGLTFDDTDSGA